ncbi:ATP-binding protein [Ramlibacter sp. PS3R-8]|uniref:sensor histidine kinase n=1 Tax=Ramlibacter sp. PS3R-8 TaxID=3133437 RepID=UPI0030B54773
MLSGTTLSADPGLVAKAIAEATDDIVFAKDLERRYQFANPAMLAAVGCTREQVIGHVDAEFLRDPVTVAQLIGIDRRVLVDGETVETEQPLRMPDGSLRYWLSRKMPLRDAQGRLIGLLGIARDITSRKLAEKQNDAGRLKLEMAVQAAGLVMAEIDYRSNQNHISAELARLLELGDGEMTVPRQAIFDRIHREDIDRYMAGIRAAMDPTGNGHLAIDVRAQLPSGTVRWLHIVLQVTFSAIDGELKPDRGVCAARDVTQEREADRHKDEFIATLAHELRNPLAPIRTGLEILRRVGELPPAAARTREMMERQLNHMVRLVDDLMDVSRISRGKLELRLAPVSVAQVVEHALEASQPGLQAAGHVLEVQVPAQPLVVRGDLTRLAQVVSNLVNNAVKYTPRGGRIALSAAVDGDEAVLAVRDDGAGIPTSLLPRVFDLFAQGDGAREKGQGGLGIGLWLVRRLVEMHGGRIDARSDGPDQGSTFTVRLPVWRS